MGHGPAETVASGTPGTALDRRCDECGYLKPLIAFDRGRRACKACQRNKRWRVRQRNRDMASRRETVQPCAGCGRPANETIVSNRECVSCHNKRVLAEKKAGTYDALHRRPNAEAVYTGKLFAWTAGLRGKDGAPARMRPLKTDGYWVISLRDARVRRAIELACSRAIDLTHMSWAILREHSGVLRLINEKNSLDVFTMTIAEAEMAAAAHARRQRLSSKDTP